MPNPISGLCAALLELGAWLAGGSADQALAWYLSVHALASLALARFALAWLPDAAARPRRAVFLLLAGCAYAVPIAGFLGVLGGIAYLRRQRSTPPVRVFESVQLPEFDPHQRPAAGFRQAGLRCFLGNSDAPMTARIGAMVALQYVSGRLASPLLRDVLADPSEDIRLLAYGMLNDQEKRINRAIDEALRQFHGAGGAGGGGAPEPRALAAARRLSDLYWELIYQELVQGDLRAHAIGESARYCRLVLAREPDHAALHLRLGRLEHQLGRHGAAEVAYRQAQRLGLPATRILPHLAELRFAEGKFAEVRQLMAELADWGSLPRLRPVIDYWNSP